MRNTALFRFLLVVTVAFVLLIGLTPQPVRAEETGAAAVHIVSWGETLGTIAEEYGVSASEIIAANSLAEPDMLYAGVQLVIPGAAATPAPSAQNGTHVVKRGETLFRIAVQYGVTIADLQAANGLASPDFIYYGQVLVIPSAGYANNVPAPSAPSGGLHVVQPGETLMRIAQQYGVSMQSIVSANGLINPSVIYVGQSLAIPGANTPVNTPPPAASTPVSGTHIVRSGETLGAIAQRYGVSLSVLVQANRLSNPSLLFVGQSLTIPGGGTNSGPAAQPGSSQGGTHVVQRGDTLFRIAVAYGVTVGDLMTTNGLSSSIIYAGQRLTIPAGGASAPAPAPGGSAPPPTTPSGKQILVDLSEQKVYAYENGQLLREFVVSTGLPATPTVQGDYAVYLKYDAQRMSGPDYDLPGVPWVMYFYQGYALHGTYWHNNFGNPMSHGCVNLRTPEAEWLYMWAPMGTPVHVQW